MILLHEDSNLSSVLRGSKIRGFFLALELVYSTIEFPTAVGFWSIVFWTRAFKDSWGLGF